MRGLEYRYEVHDEELERMIEEFEEVMVPMIEDLRKYEKTRLQDLLHGPK